MVKKQRVVKDSVSSKLFVLDTNVFMHDPASLFRFEEHDVFIPMVTLEELDNNKNGMTEVARNARQTSRFLDEIVKDNPNGLRDGYPLQPHNGGHARGRLFLQTCSLQRTEVEKILPGYSADNQILALVKQIKDSVSMDLSNDVCQTVTEKKYSDVILVSKDINIRIKAHALGLQAEDYFNDKILEDVDMLYTGYQCLPNDFWDTHNTIESGKDGEHNWWTVEGPLCRDFTIGEFVGLPGNKKTLAAVHKISAGKVTFRSLRDFSHSKNAVWGIEAKNDQQNCALNLLMDPEIDCVTLLGQAGSGKTLLTLAAGLTQVMDTKRYSEIIFTRITVPVGEDIGFLPGTEEEKMAPWMGALDDNLDVLHSGSEETSWGRAATMDLLRSRIKVKSLNFMRGRTFINKFLVIDEAQNLTPKQIKTLITRAGPGTKVVCLGNIAQIDTPYLTEGSSGLTYLVDRFKGQRNTGHITLLKGERSRLSDLASRAL
jgi:PhoH-like ATPase